MQPILVESVMISYEATADLLIKHYVEKVDQILDRQYCW